MNLVPADPGCPLNKFVVVSFTRVLTAGSCRAIRSCSEESERGSWKSWDWSSWGVTNV